MHHGPAVELGKDHSIEYKTRLGVILFFVYLLVYAGFVFIGIFYPNLMGATALAGLNLAFVYGMGLIVLAIIMGLVYNYFCTKHEDKMHKEEQK